ncbi:hypothetical protein BB561_004785 [Smittium simulii]|uniref:Uncharacterized protein n=1 Tax=Smittium simulii TaxID=133385 RepID=A0A2T9YEA8_9FUNG|nr:hypothetical protein BB561_004785 [Smittium simulii]
MHYENIVVIFQCGAEIIVPFENKYIANSFPCLKKESDKGVEINKFTIGELIKFSNTDYYDDEYAIHTLISHQYQLENEYNHGYRGDPL